MGDTCDVCSAKLVMIRGRHPGDDKRKVCPTCLMERMEMINEMSREDYGLAVAETEGETDE